MTDTPRNILELKKETIRRGLCQEYIAIWDKARDKEDIFRMACSVKGADYICSAIANRYFIDSDRVESLFQGWLNGQRIIRQNGYTAAWYNKGGKITATTTVIIATYGDYDITVPETECCHIYLAGNNSVTVNNNGIANIINYNSHGTILTVKGDGKTRHTDPAQTDTSFIHKT